MPIFKIVYWPFFFKVRLKDIFRPHQMDLLCYYLDSLFFRKFQAVENIFISILPEAIVKSKLIVLFTSMPRCFGAMHYGISLPIFLIHAPKLRVAKEQNIRIICRLGKNRNESMWMNGPINNLSLVHWLILMLWPNLNRSLRNSFWEQKGGTFPDWNSILATLIATLCTDLLDGCLWV